MNATHTNIYYYYPYYFTSGVFFIPALADDLSVDSEFPQVSSKILSVLADLNNVI